MFYLLRKLIEVTNSDLKKALDHSQTNIAKASSLETEKGKIQKEIDGLKSECSAWLETKDNLEQRPLH